MTSTEQDGAGQQQTRQIEQSSREENRTEQNTKAKASCQLEVVGVVATLMCSCCAQ